QGMIRWILSRGQLPAHAGSWLAVYREGCTTMLFRLIGRRLVFLLFVLLGVTFVTFTVSHLIPGDPARMMVGQRASEETLQRVREQLGLNQPVWVQYVRYLVGLLQGDLGTSIRTQ